MYDFSNFNTRIDEVKDWLSGEYAKVRTGRATPSILDGVLVDNFGNKSPLQHVANISIEDAKTLRISPWDKGMIKDIDAAIAAANLGVSAVADNDGVRVIFPDLTAESRQMMDKLVAEKLEQARISVKKEREEVWSDIVAKEKEKEISEDDKFSLKDDLQKLVDTANKDLEAMQEKKKQELAA